MRKLLAFLVAVVGLGMVLSGCVANNFRTTYAPNSYVQKNYIDKTKIPKSKVVGDKEIKFYVDKIIDNRSESNKKVYVKKLDLIPIGSTKFKDFQTTVRMTTEKALERTGWGVVDNRTQADFILRATINDLSVHDIFVGWTRIADGEICVLNAKDNSVVVKKHIHNSNARFLIGTPDPTGKLYFTVGRVTELYYKALIDYFSSPKFVNAIKKAYFEIVTGNKEKH